MNTPAHLAASILVWRRETSWREALAVAGGAILPDLPMFGFYVYQKLIVHASETTIFDVLYYDDRWQLFFDIFNSLPLILIGMILCHLAKCRWGVLLALSAMLHCLCDLPVHNDDAHRHFLPISRWRFESPLSYWDRDHYGHWFMPLEFLFAVVGCAYVMMTKPTPLERKPRHAPMRVLAAATLVFYLLGILFALVVWVPTLGADVGR